MKRLLLLLFLSHALSPGSHVLQNLTGDERDAERCEVQDCNLYRYHEENFIPLDQQTMTKITPKAQTASIKDLWNMCKTRLEHITTIYASSLEYLKYYMDYGKISLPTAHLSVVPTQAGLASLSAAALFPDIAKLIISGADFFSDPYTTTPVPNLKVSSFNVKHSLKFFLTSLSGTTNFPEFVAAATLDDVEIGYCDSIIRTAEPKRDWIGKLIKEDPQLLQWYSQKCLGLQQQFKGYIHEFKQRLNQTEGSHVLQRMSGCEWNEESGETKSFVQFGYDGEDFISLDFQTMKWITHEAQAVEIKQLWDAEEGRLAYLKNYYVSECPKLVQEYMHYERNFLQRKERPSVFLLQKTPSSLIRCHATGFYPDKANLFWRKDGEEIHEDVEKEEILSNHDGTFQMSSELNVSLVQQEDWRKYKCVFQLSGVKEDIIIKLNKTEIQTNWVSPSEFSVRHHVLVVVPAAVLLLMLGGILCWNDRGEESNFV
ncbi:hypothetical protein OJAV_G00236390 [Oryzias javanicus]|uniref:Ig-like domain-containing protein n=1 Tax=Oryzias javanicus TaxID=123683 RepID=A0A437BY77_ORYJA|nr:hypothetical protein OJAV_G00236390 [Oryzias javanicus]